MSQHLDYVALSATATTSSWSAPALVLTVFAGDAPDTPTPAALKFLAECGLGEGAMAHRRAPDRASCAVLGAEHHHLDLREALFREQPSGGAVIGSEDDLFVHDVLVEEPSVVQVITDVVGRVIADVGRTVALAPLAIGRHRDHVLVRAGVEASGRPGRTTRISPTTRGAGPALPIRPQRTSATRSSSTPNRGSGSTRPSRATDRRRR